MRKRDSHRTKRHPGSLRALLAAIVTLAILGGAAVIAGCGATGTTTRTQTARTTTVQTVPVEVAEQAIATIPDVTTKPTSLHDRVMAEQSHVGGSATTIALSPPDTGVTVLDPNTMEPPVTTPGQPSTAPEGTTNVVLTEGQTPLKGVWSGTAEQLSGFLVGLSPSPLFTVSALDLAKYYVRYCGEAGLRADLLWAQMLLETGYGMYGGDVSPQQNNFAGIGATGGGAAGLSYSTAEAGVMAQIAHMVAYVYTTSPVEWANATTDPRFDMVDPRGVAVVLSDLDGRWAVPGEGYGKHIEDIVRAINAFGK
jgi:hypothetical protein